jgi:hypothetical protein
VISNWSGGTALFFKKLFIAASSAEDELKPVLKPIPALAQIRLIMADAL